ncbi:uncharacterized protein LOC112156005 isoform X2 [Oryzias melastigma]|uniref:uncharacterized protein LOC112156005 isoform X2 n=1 Tax=Oryzias melastigma TaxID=30732 RepID=UPI000CF83065|nr:uncharacterized protein LOC112156005 isoform X2 [Oryzias melastigma]
MEQLHRLCFLVLLMSWVDQGQTQPLPSNTTLAMEQVTTGEPPSIDINSTWRTTDVPFSEVNSSLLGLTNATSMESNSSTWETTVVPASEVTSPTSSKMDEPFSSKATSRPQDKGEKDKPTWAYVILAFIILIIVVLSLILYFIRKTSRSYSFDLHRPTPMNNRNEPTGTFEQVYLDDFERPDLKDLTDLITDDTSSLPVANGTSPMSEENDSGGENAPREQADDKSVGSTSTSETSQTLADNQDEKKASPPVQENLLLEAAGEQENENNNNPSICSSDPFVEINLDEPAWRDQLLSPSQTSSTVTPFSILSTSPTSTISSLSFS